MTVATLLRILFIEDVPEDAELAERVLREEGLDFEAFRVETEAGLREALGNFSPDVIVSDYRMPSFDGMRALGVALEVDPAIPFIILTGSINEDTAASCMRAGATDYVIKEHMNRLPFAVREGLEKRRARISAVAAEERLRESEEKYRVLVESSTESVVVAQDALIKFANAQTENLTGRSREELINSPFADIIHEDDRENVVERHGARLRGQASPSVYSFRILRPAGEIRWVELTVATIQWEGRSATLNLLTDITDRKDAEKARQAYVERLTRTLHSSVHALASATELRDPYTAGHQRRVADLSCALAERLGWAEDEISWLRLAAGVHDIGKIQVPSEILVKPAKLTDIEWRLVQEHPRAGYELLKHIEFPWPVAEVVLQHHERLDGTGYPQGLSGKDAIHPAARILALADVMEAMSSHRPYRPALGVENALAEVKAHRGTWYDPEVVDACEVLIESGYSIPVASADD